MSALAGNLWARGWRSPVAALIHLVNNGGISVSEISAANMRSTNDIKVVNVLWDDGIVVSAKSFSTVVHKRAIIIGHAKVRCARLLIEVKS